MFNTGYFSACVPDAVDTRDGVKLIIKVRPPPALTSQLPTGVDLTLSESSVQQCGGRAEARAEGAVQAAGALLHVAPQGNGPAPCTHACFGASWSACISGGLLGAPHA